MSSIRMQRLPLDVADEVHHLALARPLATLVADRDRGADALGEGAGPDDAADVRRDDDNIIGVTELLFDIARHDRRGEEVIGRDIEEALYLTGVQVKRKHAVGSGALDQVGDEFR